MKYEAAARQFCKAIKTIAEKEDNLNNLESYLSYHFDSWLEKFAGTPDNMASELVQFANMEL